MGKEGERGKTIFIFYTKTWAVAWDSLEIAMKPGGMVYHLDTWGKEQQLDFSLEAFLFRAFLLNAEHQVGNMPLYHGLTNVLAH